VTVGDGDDPSQGMGILAAHEARLPGSTSNRWPAAGKRKYTQVFESSLAPRARWSWPSRCSC